jgi:protein KTI12
VVVLSEASLHLDKNVAYDTTRREKDTRGCIRAAVERSLHRHTLVLLDSLNNIKGYRYELFCLAKNAATRYCMVHVDTPADTCRAWNQQRDAAEQYT